MTNELKNGYLRTKTFQWTIGILLTIFLAVISYVIGSVGTLSGEMRNTNEKFNHNFTNVTNSISAIETDIEWIKSNLK